VRLAAKLTGWHIDVKSESQRKQESSEKSAEATESLVRLEGIGPKTAEVLKKAGLTQIDKLAEMKVDDLTAYQGIGAKTAEKIIESAKNFLKAYEAQEAEREKKSKK